MASSTTHFCTLCQEDDASTQAVSWCLECEDWLCIDCEKHHGRSKTSKLHKTIAVAAYDTLPLSVLEISNRCSEHNYVFDHFCSFQGVPCCIHCVSKTHRECELSPLVDVLQNTNESSAVSHLERDLNEIMENFKVIEDHLFDKITKVNDRKKHCINEIKRVRTSVKERLDKIERDILDELSQKEINIKQNIEMLANQIESKKRRVVNLQDSLLKTKKYATDLKIFLSIKEMEKQTSEDAKYLEDLEKGDQMALKILEFDISPALQSLQRDCITFGKISVTSVPCTLKFTRTSQGQAQLPLPVVSTVDEVHPVKLLTINIAKPLHITACALLPTGECIVAEYKKDRLLFYNKKGIYVRDVVKIFGLPSDMCYVKENIVCISFPAKAKVNFVDFSENKIVKIKQMESRCYGIDCDNGQIFVGLPDVNAVAIMNLDGKKLKSVFIPEKDITRIACFKNYIYCTNSETGEVSCYDMKGKMVWKHKYEALIEPWSIAIDKSLSIIYVAGYDSNNLFAISLNGNQSKIVLSEKNGLNGIKSINIENKQLVCNQSDGFILLYQL